MPTSVTIALYSDLSCPYAYLTAFRLRKLRDEYRGRITIIYKSLALEYVNTYSTFAKMLRDTKYFVTATRSHPPFSRLSH